MGRERRQAGRYGASVPRDTPVRPSLDACSAHDAVPHWQCLRLSGRPPEQLEKMWQHKSYVMQAVLETKPKKGGSNYPRHDPAKRRLESGFRDLKLYYFRLRA